MRRFGFGLSVALGICAATAVVRPAADTVDAHIAAGKLAAGNDHVELFESTCGSLKPQTPPAATTSTSAPPSASPAPRAASAPPPSSATGRAAWHADPVKVFDNLYFVGQTEYSAWAVTTSEGIVLIDTIFDYSVEDEVVGGLRTLGLDPATIKYAIVSHGHGDHSGGAKYLQDHFGTKIILSADDWGLLDRSNGTRPARDLVAVDGQTLTLGDTTLTLYLTPGHTFGTISTLVPVKDHGTPHLAAEWGGTAFNWVQSPAAYITAERPEKFWFDAYAASARRFRDIAARAGADVLLSNHTKYDGSTKKLPAMAARKAGESNPYVVGQDSVQRYLIAAEECAKAGSLR